jgi:hypothetical protein
MSQDELAKLVEAPLSTVKYLGNRPYSKSFAKKIWFNTGGIWFPAKKQWFFDLYLLGRDYAPGERFVPFTLDLFEEYRSIWTAPVENQQEHIVIMHAALDELFRCVSADRWMKLRLRYSSFVEDCCLEFGLGESADLWERACSRSPCRNEL